MAQATMAYILSYVMQEIPMPMLELAFEPRKFQTNIDQRIISEIIEGPILLDTNLVSGKRKYILLSQQWRMPLEYVQSFNLAGSGVQGEYYMIPPEAREHRNISQVIGITPSLSTSLPGSGVSYNGVGGFGNTVGGMLSMMLNTRTFGNYPNMPQVTMEGTNIIRFYPQVMCDGVSVTVLLEFDSEFLNMNRSAIFAMRSLVLCAVKRYIAVKLRVAIDESQIVAGMEIGAVKDKIMEYEQDSQRYTDLLINFKGAAEFDARTLSRTIYHAL